MVINIPQTYKILSFAKNTFIIFANDSTTYIFTPMKYIFFLVVITACTNPSKEQQAMQMDSLRNRISVLENAMAINCSRLDILDTEQISVNLLIDSLSTRIGNNEQFTYYVNAKADSSLSIVFNIDKKALRRYNTGMIAGGIVDFFTGGKLSKVIRSVKGVEHELRR